MIHEDEIKFLVKGSIVQCVDDSNKPDDVGDWPKKGSQYYLEGFTKNLLDDNLCLMLKDMKTNEPYKGYNSKRFILVVGMFGKN